MTDFETWLTWIQREYPDNEIQPTRDGCEVHFAEGRPLELSYDPDPDAEARVRY